MDSERTGADTSFSASNGPCGVLVLHGFTGSPRSMRPLAEALADAAFSVELPLLPGHGTSVEELDATGFAEWSAAVDEAFGDLARSDRTVVVGHSMGGTLALGLALDHPDLAGLALVNPLVKPPAPSMIETLRAALAAGARMIPSIGADMKRAGVSTGGYQATPIEPLLSLFAGVARIAPRLGEITCPVLCISSRVDHIVPTDSGDLLEERLAGGLERVWLDESYHVAMLDNDGEEIEERIVAFASKLAVN